MRKTVICIMQLFLAAGIYGSEPEITSKQVEFRQRENKVIFKDNVKIKYGNNLICTDLAIKDDKSNIVEMIDNIKGDYYLKKTTDTIKLTAKKGKWDFKKNELDLTGRPWILYISTNGTNMEIESDRIILDANTDISRFYGNIVLKHKHNIAKSQEAEYQKNDNMVVLFAKDGILPNLDYSNSHNAKFVAEKITILADKEKLILDKKVNVKIYTQ